MGLLESAMGMLGGNQGGLTKVLAGLLSGGGLQNILGQFQQAGLGHKAASWVGSGQNDPLEPGEVEQVMGSVQLDQIAQQAGVSRDAAAGGLAQLLPQAINHLTPEGQVPQGGVQHNENDLMGMLGGLFGGR